MKTVTVQYFAALREQAGKAEERRHTEARTCGDLYEELCTEYRFTLPSKYLRVARNLEMVPMTETFEDGDSLVFIPPVAGG